MTDAFITGILVGISLIVAIGAQNIFVLRQGIIGKHVFYVALFCATADTLLINIGVSGFSFFLNKFILEISHLLFGISALWLLVYGFIRLLAAIKADSKIELEGAPPFGLFPTLSIAAILTFANPHVYLDTMILIGSISQQFSGFHKIAFALGAVLASFVFFFSLAYGARILTPIMLRPFSWKILDSLIALIMFTIAFKLVSAGNWL